MYVCVSEYRVTVGITRSKAILVSFLCSTFPKTANVSREDLRGKAERSQGKKKGKEKEQFRKNKQGKVRHAEKNRKNRKGRKKEGTAKHDSVLTCF